MEHHARLSRMRFINDSTDVRDMFKFAMPEQVINAMQVYVSSFYGSILFDLYGGEAEKIFRCWNTALKLVWQVPRTTHGYLVENLLGKSCSSLRNSILTRFIKFARTLAINSSKEIATLAGLCMADARSTLGKNVRNISLETCRDARWSSPCQFQGRFRKIPVPELEQ